MPDQHSYAGAGVDINAGERAVDLMRAAVQRTARGEVIGGIGGFAGLFDVSALTRMRRPLLATSTDGVGTKVMIARRLGVYGTIGIDFASRAELIAGSLEVEEIRESIGADSLGFVSLGGLIEATTLPAGQLCVGCFSGEYPVPVAEAEQGKNLLEAATGA